jgi:hypothetical protein
MLEPSLHGTCARSDGASARPSRLSTHSRAAYEPLEGDPLDLEDLERAAEDFRARILRLVEHSDTETP